MAIGLAANGPRRETAWSCNVSAISTAALITALIVQQPQQQQPNDRVGPAPANSGAVVAPTMRDGMGSVFALSTLTGGNGQGGMYNGTTGGSQNLYRTNTAGKLSSMNGMVSGAGPGGLAGMSGGGDAMPGSGELGGAKGMRGGLGYRSPSRHGPTLRGGLGARGKGKAGATKFDLLGAQPPTAELNGLMRGLLTSGPLTPEEATLIVHALVAADSANVKDPHARASLRNAGR